MRHLSSVKHFSRTSEHRKAMLRNMAQSLFQYGEIRTTLPKAKFLRPFVERVITLARVDNLHNRQRVEAMLSDRAVIGAGEQETYEAMSDSQREKVLFARSGRRHRRGVVPASYNKKRIPFVATSILHHLFSEVAPKFVDRPGGYTRIIKLSRRRIGDNSQLAILQLVGTEEEAGSGIRKAEPGRRRRKAERRVAFAQGKAGGRKSGKKASKPAAGDAAESND